MFKGLLSKYNSSAILMQAKTDVAQPSNSVLTKLLQFIFNSEDDCCLVFFLKLNIFRYFFKLIFQGDFCFFQTNPTLVEGVHGLLKNM